MSITQMDRTDLPTLRKLRAGSRRAGYGATPRSWSDFKVQMSHRFLVAYLDALIEKLET